MWTLDHLGQFIDAVSWEASSTQEELVELKTDLAKAVVEKMKEKDPLSIVGIADDMVVDYLVSEWFFDAIKDNMMGKALELSSLHGLLSEIREKLKKVDTKEQLDQLRAEVLSKIDEKSEGSQDSAWATEENTSQDQKNEENQNSSDSSTPIGGVSPQKHKVQPIDSHHEIKNRPSEQIPYIEATIKSAEGQIGKPYQWWATGPSGFDCSGLWNWAFQEQGIKFDSRFTAAAFESSDVNIPKEEVRVWDFMYWDEQPGKKRHNPIYHIEMVVGQPYPENGKWYVKTIGSSTDKWVLDHNGQKTAKSWVWYRVREITGYRHFGRPPYYLQLAKHQASGDRQQLIASAGRVSPDTKKELVA